MVLVVLALGAAVTLPALLTPVRQDATFGHVVRSARQAAIARAQVLDLSIGASGEWTLRASGDSMAVARGTLDPSVGGAVELALSPAGGCVLTTVLLAGWASWDTARCLPIGPAA